MSANSSKVEVAVKFLENENIESSSLKEKVGFLRSKGLSEREIESALSRCGLPYEVANVEEVEAANGWRLFDYLKGMVIGAASLSAANFTYKGIILPYIIDKLRDARHDEELRTKIRSIESAAQQSAHKLAEALTVVRASMERQEATLASIAERLSVDTVPTRNVQSSDVDRSLQDVRKELSSVKNMLLGRRQFPPPSASLSAPPKPSIPAWQKANDGHAIVKADEISPTVTGHSNGDDSGNADIIVHQSAGDSASVSAGVSASVSAGVSAGAGVDDSLRDGSDEPLDELASDLLDDYSAEQFTTEPPEEISEIVDLKSLIVNHPIEIETSDE